MHENQLLTIPDDIHETVNQLRKLLDQLVTPLEDGARNTKDLHRALACKHIADLFGEQLLVPLADALRRTHEAANATIASLEQPEA